MDPAFAETGYMLFFWLFATAESVRRSLGPEVLDQIAAFARASKPRTPARHPEQSLIFRFPKDQSGVENLLVP